MKTLQAIALAVGTTFVLVLLAVAWAEFNAINQIQWDHGQGKVEPAPSPGPAPGPAPSPSPKPSPAPLPQDESYCSALKRAVALDHDLIILFTMHGCSPCRTVLGRDLPGLRQHGELAIVDTDTADGNRIYYKAAEEWNDGDNGLPALAVYTRSAGQWGSVRHIVDSNHIYQFAWGSIGTAQSSTSKELGASLLVLHDGGEASRTMFPVLAQVAAAGHRVVYADVNDPANAKYLTRFDYKDLPYLVMYRDHEATEVLEGQVNKEQLLAWFAATDQGKSSGYVRSVSQPELKEDDLVYLHRILSPGSCGMLGCMVHRGGMVLEYTDASGRPVQKPTNESNVVQLPTEQAPSVPWPGSGRRGRR